MLPKEGIVVSTVDLIAALVSDLFDRTFDGRDASGNVVYVGNNHRVNLDSYTMRKKLAEAVLVYAKGLQESGKLSLADRDSLKILDSIVPWLNLALASCSKDKDYYGLAR